MNKPEHWAIAKLLKGEASPPEEEQIMEWVNASPENRKEFEQLKTVWDSQEEKGKSFDPDLTKAWDQIQQELEPTKQHKIPTWFYRVAAILVLGFGVFYFTSNQTDTPNIQEAVAEINEFQAVDMVKVVVLPDGTEVTLNKGALVTYSSEFGQNERKVSLTGLAFFQVKRDEERPFIIESNSTTTQVLGTSFSVDPRDEYVVVSVVSGKVSFMASESKDEVILTKGEKGTYDSKAKSVTASANEDLNFLSWKTGKLSFEDASLDVVIKDLQRHYEVKIVNENKAALRLTASFDNQTLEEVLMIISSTLDIEVEESTSENYLILQ